ncbi:hypothetical protein IQ249_13265 [Lusitaniella coriacea LEGE 07157]|uniref:Uncharacterized protein n=1 Tax=Lusitaniella coriacea LEGE 07157 TaxID=945747 RepID=A0A8J7DXK5_9CYAN|nr:hypothetical protein [Lusitaniella coriacea]MBE9116870.1 hypothetical protein [Lusitaniella coriacea LEGE 07157]
MRAQSKISTKKNIAIENFYRVFRKYKANMVLSALILFSVFLIYEWAVELNLNNDKVSTRMLFHAFPVAISDLYHNRIGDYTAYQAIANWFTSNYTSMSVEQLISGSINLEIPIDDRTYYWAVDDRGLADYIKIAFTLFGANLSSLFYFYFAILALSGILYIIAYFLNPAILTFGIFINAAIIATLPTFNLWGISAPKVTLYESRTFEILAYMAIFHIAALAISSTLSSKVGAVKILTALGQLFIFLFIYNCRSTLGWQYMAVIIFVAGLFAYKLIKYRFNKPSIPKFPQQTFGILLPAVLLLVGFHSLTAYQHATFNERYFADRGSRTFWHNLVMGLGDHDIGKPYGLVNVDDRVAVRAVIKYLHDSKSPRYSNIWTEDTITNSFGGHTEFDFSEYEQGARNFYFHIWREQPLALLLNHLHTRPMKALQILINHSSAFRLLSDSENRHLLKNGYQQGIYYNPFDYRAIGLVVSAILVLPRKTRLRGDLLVLCLVFFAFSFIPSVIFYTSATTLSGAYVATAVLLYAAIAIILLPKLKNWSFLWRRLFD